MGHPCSRVFLETLRPLQVGTPQRPAVTSTEWEARPGKSYSRTSTDSQYSSWSPRKEVVLNEKEDTQESLKVMVVCGGSWTCIWGANSEFKALQSPMGFIGTVVRGGMLGWKDHGPGDIAAFRVPVCWLVPMGCCILHLENTFALGGSPCPLALSLFPRLTLNVFTCGLSPGFFFF